MNEQLLKWLHVVLRDQIEIHVTLEIGETSGELEENESFRHSGERNECRVEILRLHIVSGHHLHTGLIDGVKYFDSPVAQLINWLGLSKNVKIRRIFVFHCESHPDPPTSSTVQLTPQSWACRPLERSRVPRRHDCRSALGALAGNVSVATAIVALLSAEASAASATSTSSVSSAAASFLTSSRWTVTRVVSASSTVVARSTTTTAAVAITLTSSGSSLWAIAREVSSFLAIVACGSTTWKENYDYFTKQNEILQQVSNSATLNTFLFASSPPELQKQL
ncbi:hypothetical protein GCK72_016166 [Caenorhabditis remanei]|uniref:Uncharacterized protein n=1 Tax=Caenorhabditis remanei TaxID=31234 RepID=A0A6A5GYF1_CAERE|nr:hypothetical protein GCK72_016166 [Caenorhabditis remanei]KAF1759699.1 hypothetical protein GCK72_016166 [Caenorhabditis remanei]